ncbi:hypothetical protein LWF15_17015 [Kineosporia rhizophila]|uniref:hypothetical protein n=1 Tax=Kineosporia TaxID=49184 RepID=UPI000A7274E8|nr:MULTISPECIES: hypothetical protein [Kineosporia]MCE0537205.1 hypothetical protein [Kineosporia rhizophila]GLY15948.1 hypothetical protein Kisp01_29630 [Kineosporia sp. NBRC 101677]
MSTPSPIVSGRAYRILAMGGGQPVQSLEDLLGTVSEFTIDHGNGYVVRGSSRRDEGTVKFYEKDSGGTGKDLRVWRLVQAGPDTFTAEHVVG